MDCTRTNSDFNMQEINDKIEELINFQEYLRDTIAEINLNIEKMLMIKIGPSGDKGDKGDKGDRGEEGKEGPPGKNEKGSPGRDGIDGIDGYDGCDGRKGKKGKKGKDGKDGKDGKNSEFTEFLVKIIETENVVLEYSNIRTLGSLIMRNQNFENCKKIESIDIKINNGKLYFRLDSQNTPKYAYVSANGKKISSELISYSYCNTNIYKFCFDGDQNIEDYFYPGCIFSLIFYWC